MFKPNISPTLLDQMNNPVLETKVLKTGEKVIVDPEATTERVMLWFYLLINVGAFMQVATAYTEKYIGWWLTFLLPLILYLPLLPLLFYLKKRLIIYPLGGSDLGNVFRILGICFRRGRLMRLGRGGFFDSKKPLSFIFLLATRSPVVAMMSRPPLVLNISLVSKTTMLTPY